MRRLMLIRIVHSAADMGSVKDGLVKEGIARLGEEGWKENQLRIEKFWREVEGAIEGLGLDYSRVRIYQDGMPCGGELALKIVNETAEKGSLNYQIVKKLIEKGAIIEATESPELLLKEYEHIRAFANARTEEEKAEAKRRYEDVKDRLMEERDTFIARAIDVTLREGETGLLFIGAAHNILPRLPGDIEARSLD